VLSRGPAIALLVGAVPAFLPAPTAMRTLVPAVRWRCRLLGGDEPPVGGLAAALVLELDPMPNILKRALTSPFTYKANPTTSRAKVPRMNRHTRGGADLGFFMVGQLLASLHDFFRQAFQNRS
jgi:hypothetical protein